MPQFDATLLFGECPHDPRGRKCAENLRTLLERHVSIGTSCLNKRKANIYIPDSGYLAEQTTRQSSRESVADSRLVFFIITPELCMAHQHVQDFENLFSDIFSEKKRKRLLIPIYLSYRSETYDPNITIPFDLEGVVGINLSEIVGSRTLMDVDPTRVRYREMDKMCVHKFSELLNQRTRRFPRRLTPQSDARRQMLYKLARETMAEIKAKNREKCVSHLF